MNKLDGLTIIQYQTGDEHESHQWYDDIYFNSYREATEYLLSQGYEFDIEFMEKENQFMCDSILDNIEMVLDSELYEYSTASVYLLREIFEEYTPQKHDNREGD